MTDTPPKDLRAVSGRNVLTDILGIAVVAIVILIAGNSAVGRRQIRGIVDNDAVGYVTAARHLANTGEIVSHVIYPSTLSQPTTKTRLYMPGYYWNLAAVYKLFGYGTGRSIFVSQFAYTLGAICTYLIGLRFFTRKTALAAAGFFLIYPANLYFAQTAMAETSVVAAAAVAFCVFVHLPRRWMPWIGPLLVLLPFLYRETGAFLAVPMAIVLLMAPTAEGRGFLYNLGHAVLFFGLSVLLLGAVYASPISKGRPSLITLDIFLAEADAERIYRDSVAWDELKPTSQEWRQTLAKRFGENCKAMLRRYDRRKREATIPMLLPLLLAIPIGFICGLWKRDPISLGGAALLLVTICFICAFYSIHYDRPLRVAMFALPFVALMAAKLWVALFSLLLRHLPSEDRLWPQVIGAVCVAAWMLPISFKAFKDMVSRDTEDERAAVRVEALHHDDSTVLAGPPQLGLPYLSLHPDVTYSFVPANARTLKRLSEKYRLTTLILDPEDTVDLTPQDILDDGLRLYRRVLLDERHYLIYRRPQFAGESDSWQVEVEEKWSARLRKPR